MNAQIFKFNDENFAEEIVLVKFLKIKRDEGNYTYKDILKKSSFYIKKESALFCHDYCYNIKVEEV